VGAARQLQCAARARTRRSDTPIVCIGHGEGAKEKGSQKEESGQQEEEAIEAAGLTDASLGVRSISGVKGS
jgi:triosephosphate isomerase